MPNTSQTELKGEFEINVRPPKPDEGYVIGLRQWKLIKKYVKDIPSISSLYSNCQGLLLGVAGTLFGVAWSIDKYGWICFVISGVAFVLWVASIAFDKGRGDRSRQVRGYIQDVMKLVESAHKKSPTSSVSSKIKYEEHK